MCSVTLLVRLAIDAEYENDTELARVELDLSDMLSAMIDMQNAVSCC